MKRKEIKNLAAKIAKEELVIQTSDDPLAIRRAEQAIMELSGHVDKIEDMAAIDEAVQDILEKSLKNI